mgnify:CR=1 FL=1
MKITRRTEQEINISELKAAIKEGRGLEVIRPHDEITLALDTGETITPVCGYVGPICFQRLPPRNVADEQDHDQQGRIFQKRSPQTRPRRYSAAFARRTARSDHAATLMRGNRRRNIRIF